MLLNAFRMSRLMATQNFSDGKLMAARMLQFQDGVIRGYCFPEAVLVGRQATSGRNVFLQPCHKHRLEHLTDEI
ncbi:unnamed protein product [Macrosiphum euphorbiae]|uniref:Uncharacterized protein n=1 Tax=Macrosiphum euphorbiae TaxID=13131 RepID=A0AAV0WMW2_9HEMI|nr:unnamed protein product [Macrosiphum euphorbiae]